MNPTQQALTEISDHIQGGPPAMTAEQYARWLKALATAIELSGQADENAPRKRD